MRIALMVEGETEKVFLPYLRGFLKPRLPGKMPRIEVFRYDGRIPKEGQLKGVVRRLLRDSKRPADAVIALTDVYTGTRDFTDAADAKAKMRAWVGDEPRFFPRRRGSVCLFVLSHSPGDGGGLGRSRGPEVAGLGSRLRVG